MGHNILKIEKEFLRDSEVTGPPSKLNFSKGTFGWFFIGASLLMKH
jgi:hypothetical protein